MRCANNRVCAHASDDMPLYFPYIFLCFQMTYTQCYTEYVEKQHFHFFATHQIDIVLSGVLHTSFCNVVIACMYVAH